MAGFGEKIAASIVSDILKKLSSYAAKKIIGIWKVEKEFQKLENTLGMLLATLRVAEKRQDNNELVERWLERLKDVAYEADDVLGEFSFEATRMGFDMRIDHSMMEKVCAFFSNIHAVKFRSNMADKIEKIYKKLDDIGEDMKRFNYILGGVNIDHSDQNDRAGPIITSPVIEDLHFSGRENEKIQLIDMLIGSSSSNEETLSVVSIVGIGGLGKTTLARIVYNDESVVEHFDVRMWVWVSRDFEVRKLREGMVQSLSGVKSQSSETDEVIQKKLDEKIGGKKFLLVLDNVWNADIGGWEKLRASLKMGIQQGSKIIVTTRDTSVASIIRTLPEPLHLEGLSEDDSWSLFQKRAFAIGGARMNPNTERIGRELVEKCMGVPLAIQSLGALMFSKKTDDEWASIQFSEIWKVEGQDNISSVLKLSYHDMHPPLKRCFTYCSIFPKGYKIVKKTLIQMWMAEGLLQSSSDDKLMEDVGLEYLKSLVWVFFLHAVERDELGEEVECKMHDLVHDLAQSIIGNECRIIEDFDSMDKPIVGETRHLSVACSHMETTPEKFNKMEKVRAYLSLGGSYSHHDPSPFYAKLFSNFKSYPSPFYVKLFSNFKSLRVLDLTSARIRSLPPSFGELKQLRYLDLSGNRFATFPKSVTKLYNLQTLTMLNVSSLQGILPKGITKMINLRHLEVDHRLRFPKGIGQLTNLQTLNYFRLDKDSAGIGELRDLRLLRGTLELDLENRHIIKNDTAANLEELRLRELVLTFESWRFGARDPQPGSDSDNKLLESVKPHKNIISLRVIGFKGTKAPTWLDGSGTSHLSFLQVLHLVNCPNIKSLSLIGLCSLRWLRIYECPNLSLGLGKGLTALEDIRCRGLMSTGVPPEEDGMPDLISLKTLKIYKCNSLAALPDGFFSLFTSLETLEMLQCSFVGRLPESIGNLSSLRVLKIQSCRGLPALLVSFGNLLKLQHLTIEDYGNLAALPERFGNLLELQHLTLSHCGSLVTLPESFGNLLKLRQLTIKVCGSLAALPESFGNLSELQHLTILSCGSLAALPESFGNLLTLQHLTMLSCGSLAALPESFGNLLKLQDLTIEECGNLAALPERFGNLLKLQRLTISRCGSLVTLPESFGNLLKLQWLTIKVCGSLSALPESFGNLLKLQDLTILNCGSLAALPESFGNLLKLQDLTIEECGNLAALPESFGNLSELQNLSIKICKSLATLPKSLGSSLESLDVAHCNALTALPESLGDISSLKTLHIYSCANLASLTERICGLTSLASLVISYCEAMKSFPDGLHNLVSLHSLSIDGLKSLDAFPDGLRNLSSLRILKIMSCPRLMSLPDCFEGLTSLHSLELSYLENLMALPKGLGKLSSLHYLSLDGCENLKSLPEGIQNLTSLQILSMTDCPQLKKRYRQRKFRGLPPIISHIPVIQM